MYVFVRVSILSNFLVSMKSGTLIVWFVFKVVGFVVFVIVLFRFFGVVLVILRLTKFGRVNFSVCFLKKVMVIFMFFSKKLVAFFILSVCSFI